MAAWYIERTEGPSRKSRCQKTPEFKGLHRKANYCLKVGPQIHCRMLSFQLNFVSMRTNINHPKQGSVITVEPIRDIQAIMAIKQILIAKPRDYCLFVFGINTAYRASELLSISCGQVKHLAYGDNINLMQQKTKRLRLTTLNRSAVTAVHNWLAEHPNPNDTAPLFLSRSGGSLSVPTLSKMVKGWCAEVGLHGNYASHTLRKTWGYHKLRKPHPDIPDSMVLPIMMLAYDHRSPWQTLQYVCVQDEEVRRLFLSGEL